MSHYQNKTDLSNSDVGMIALFVVTVIALIFGFAKALDHDRPEAVAPKVTNVMFEGMTCQKQDPYQSKKDFIQTCVKMCEAVGCSKLEVKF